MYFNLELLCRQGRGKFSAAWLAATRGTKMLPKRDIEATRIDKLCEDLQSLVISESHRPKDRASLCLSAKLMHDNVVEYLHYIRHPTLEKPVMRKATRVHRIKDKAKKAAISIPDVIQETEQVYTIKDVEAALKERQLASADSITMQEEFPTRVTAQDEAEFGDFGGLEAQMYILEKGPPLPNTAQSQFQNILQEVVATVHEQLPSEVIPDERDGQPSRKKLRLATDLLQVLAELESPAIIPHSTEPITHPSVIPPGLQVPALPVQQAPLETEPLDVAPVSLEVQTGAADADIFTAALGKRRSLVPGKKIDKYLIQEKQKTKKITRSSDIDDEIFQVKDAKTRFVTTYPEFGKGDNNDEQIQETYVNVYSVRGSEFIIGDRSTDRPSSRLSERRLWDHRRRTQPSTEIVLRRDATEGTPTAMEIDHPVVQPEDGETILRLSQETPRKARMFSPTVETMEADVPAMQQLQQTLEAVLEDPQETLHQPSRLQTSLGISVPVAHSTTLHSTDANQPSVQLQEEIAIQTIDEEFKASQKQDAIPAARKTRALSPFDSTRHRKSAKQRQYAIMRIVSDWNFDVTELTIDKVCQPISRRNLIIAFNDLLSLSKHKYVKLIRHPESIELKNIEKGSKIL